MTAPGGKAKAKPRGKPFAKGQSGNPGGRPKSQREVDELVRKAFTPEDAVGVLRRLQVLAHHGNVHAAKEFLDRVLGKPTFRQELSGPNGGDIPISESAPTTGEVRERLAELIAIANEQRAGGAGGGKP